MPRYKVGDKTNYGTIIETSESRKAAVKKDLARDFFNRILRKSRLKKNKQISEVK